MAEKERDKETSTQAAGSDKNEGANRPEALQSKRREIGTGGGLTTIRGERRQEHEEEREGFYRNERSYGGFYRVIPVPEGTIAESAKATFRNGVLEIIMQAPSREVTRGRRLEISEAGQKTPEGGKTEK